MFLFNFPSEMTYKPPTGPVGSVVVRRRPLDVVGAVVRAGGEWHNKYFRGRAYHVWLKGLSGLFFQNFGFIQCNGQTKVVHATIRRHSSPNCLIFAMVGLQSRSVCQEVRLPADDKYLHKYLYKPSAFALTSDI